MTAAGICGLVAAGLPLLIHFLEHSQTAANLPPSPLEIGAFAVFGLALSAATLDKARSPWRLWISLGIQSAGILVMAVHDTGIAIFPLLVVVAWQATLMMPFYGALAWILVQTAILWIVLWPQWNSFSCQVMLGMFVAFQFFGVFAARVVRAEASRGQELAQINAELRATQALLANAVRAEERVRISRELHDAWGHHLTALNLQLEYASHLATGPVRESLDEAKHLSRSLLTKVRDVVGTLQIAERCDVSSMLRELISGLPQPAVHLSMPQDLQALSAIHAQVILRCVQEIITNAVKHADAKNLWIDIDRNDDGMRIVARDDGRGIESVKVGKGLSGMRDRFEELGGKLTIVSQVGSGFSLDGWLPHEVTSS